ncbi:hypothetical protein BD779DRAFT_1558693, partial [Infundibulicybe gibba]
MKFLSFYLDLEFEVLQTPAAAVPPQPSFISSPVSSLLAPAPSPTSSSVVIQQSPHHISNPGSLSSPASLLVHSIMPVALSASVDSVIVITSSPLARPNSITSPPLPSPPQQSSESPSQPANEDISPLSPSLPSQLSLPSVPPSLPITASNVDDHYCGIIST